MKRIAYVVPFAVALSACTTSNPNDRITGQTDFVSAPMAGTSSGGGANGLGDTAGGATGAGGAGGSQGTPAVNPQPQRTVEETDLYRLEGTRLYYLNGYRGLMVFDVSDVDHPKMLGRSAIYGSPVEMLVRNGIAIVVVADWYGQLDDGTPFHGSIVRGLDATDPTNIKVLGEAKLGGWVQRHARRRRRALRGQRGLWLELRLGRRRGLGRHDAAPASSRRARRPRR